MDHRERTLAAQIPDVFCHPLRHVQRLVRAELLTAAVRDGSPRAS
jgi:hypothetical protein